MEVNEGVQGTGGGELSDEQMDSLVGETSSQPSRDIQMKGEAQAATPQEYSLKVGGKEIKAPLDKIMQWAQMGYEYPQKAKEFNQLKSKFDGMTQKEQELTEREQKFKPYLEIDQYAAQNPDWWNQVQEAYKQKLAGAQSNPEIQQLKQELQEIKEFKNEILNEKKNQKVSEEDKKLATDVESIRKTFPNLDFDSPDENGMSLEMRVLEHADKNGLPNFRAAFRDLMHEDLISRAREEGKLLVSKEVQKRTKLGILGESSKPTKGLKVAENVKDKSYEELMREALAEVNSN